MKHRPEIAYRCGPLALERIQAPGRWYQLQYTTTLAQGGWSNLGGIVAAIGPTVTTIDRSATDAQRFYRVGILP